jgi:hypothetical protein
MDTLSRIVNTLRHPPLWSVVLLVWFTVCLLASSFRSGTVACLLFAASGFTVAFIRWRKRRLAVIRDAGLQRQPNPDRGRLWNVTGELWVDVKILARFVAYLWMTALVRSAWNGAIPAVPGLTAGPLKLVPRLHFPQLSIDNDLALSASPGTVHADVDAYQQAAAKLQGMLRWPSWLGPRIRSLTIVPTTPGDCRVEIAFRDPFEKILRLVQLQRPTKEHHLTYGIRADGSPAMINYLQSVLIGGLTRRGKSVVGKVFVACLQWLGVPTVLYIADLKDGIELPEFSKVGRLGTSSVRVGGYATTVKEAQAMIKLVHDEMVRRAEVMGLPENRGKPISRQWLPTEEHPLLVVWLDETIPMKGLLKVDEPVGKIAYVGSGRAVVLWCNSQLGEKAILGEVRDLIPQRVCFAVQTYQQADMILGDGAHLAGGLPHKLGSVQGVGYSWLDGDETYAKFRAANVTPAEAAGIARGELPEGLGAAKQPDPRVRHWLYRRFDDSAEWVDKYGDRPTYIGIHSGRKGPAVRFRQHELAKGRPEVQFCELCGRTHHTWNEHGTRTELVEIKGTRKDLEREEELAIKTELPVFNIVHNRGSTLARRIVRPFRRSAAGSRPTRPSRGNRRPSSKPRTHRPEFVPQNLADSQDGAWTE